MGIFNYIAERKIQEAIQNGEFDHLEGFGKPVDNSEYFKVPEEERLAYHILKNAGVVPEEIEIRKSIQQLKTEIKKALKPEELSDLYLRKQALEDKLIILAESRIIR
jgi:DNA polymerase/3'-5' exonuclease PolX